MLESGYTLPSPGHTFTLDICCLAVYWNPDCLVPRIPLYLMQSILGNSVFLRIIRSVNNWCVELCRKYFELKVFGLFVVFVSLLWKLTVSVTDNLKKSIYSLHNLWSSQASIVYDFRSFVCVFLCKSCIVDNAITASVMLVCSSLDFWSW